MARCVPLVCLLLIGVVATAAGSAAGAEGPTLRPGERVVLACLGLIGTEEPGKAKRARRVLALQDEGDWLRPLSLALTCEPVSLRVFAAERLGRLQDERALRPLWVRSLRERDDAVRRALAAALRRRACAQSVRVLAGALWSLDARTRCRAADMLGRLGDVRACAHLLRRWEGRAGDFPAVVATYGKQVAYLRDFDVEVAKTSFITDPVIGGVQSVSVQAVKILSTAQLEAVAERTALRRALVALRGRDLGSSVGAWRKSWNENQERLLDERAAR